MKVLYVATVVKTHIMEFHLPYLKMMKDMGWETAVAAKNDYDNPNDCQIPNCDKYYDIPFERNPFKIENLKAYRMLKKIIDQGNYDIIHCHTPVGAMVARLAAERARKNGCKVFYTAHGFHFYHGAPFINWLIYYPVERALARKTDVLITINQEDYERAKRFHAKRIEYVPGVGIDISKFQRDQSETDLEKYKSVGNKIREEFSIPSEEQILLSVGEVNRNKNHRIVIDLLPDLKNTWYIICGKGPQMEEYQERAKKLGVSDRLIMTGYRTDVADFYRAADIFVFPSFREGLPVSVMEAMAAGLPVVCSEIRGCRDLVVDQQGGFWFDPERPVKLLSLLQTLLSDDKKREKFGKYNLCTIEQYDIRRIAEKIRNLYLDISK